METRDDFFVRSDGADLKNGWETRVSNTDFYNSFADLWSGYWIAKIKSKKSLSIKNKKLKPHQIGESRKPLEIDFMGKIEGIRGFVTRIPSLTWTRVGD